MKKILRRGNSKLISFFSVVVFVISMLPIWYLAGYARPSGDDFGYSELTHAAWLDTHSLIEVFKAAIETVKRYYGGWNGDWFTTFLFSLMPEVFVPYSFWIVPYIMTGAVIAATLVFMHEICVKAMGSSFAECLVFTSLILFASYQYIPSTAIGMYWYVGAVHYVLPHAAGLLGIAFMSKFIRMGKVRYFVGLILCAFMIGGSSYFTSIMLFMALFFTGIFSCRKERKKALMLLIPFLVCAIGFIIQCKSPGNAIRGGESFGFSPSLVIFTIVESLKRGFIMIGSYGREKTLIFVILIIIALFGWEVVSRIEKKKGFNYPVPILFVILMYGTYCAMFAPEVYSEVYDSIGISKGPATIQYFTFLITGTFSILYCEGWIVQRIQSKAVSDKFENFMEQKYRSFILFPGLLCCLILVMLNRGWLRDSVDMRAYEYVSSGQAEDFRKQIASQMEILLDDSIKDAYLVPINPDQGPLMHMPVTTDENAFTNRVVSNFYRKDRVIMIDE